MKETIYDEMVEDINHYTMTWGSNPRVLILNPDVYDIIVEEGLFSTQNMFTGVILLHGVRVVRSPDVINYELY